MISITDNIKKRDYKLIKNNFNLIKDKNISIHLCIYYLEDNKVRIIIRRLDNDIGWDFDIKVKIFSEDNIYNSLISVGSCEDNEKIIDLYTKIKVIPKDYKNLSIPKTIVQTNNIIIKNKKHQNTIYSLLDNNPDYCYEFFNNSQAREFIFKNFKNNILDNNIDNNNNYSDVLNAFDLIIPGAIKADLFRYCYLYINGGFYFDSKITCFRNIDDLLNEDDKYLLCIDDAKESMYNGIIGIMTCIYTLH